MRAVKLGGSVLTNKGTRGQARYETAVGDRLAGEIHQAQGADFVVHGGGSFGHPVALAHGLGARRLEPAEVPAAFSEVRAAMSQLTGHVMGSLRAAGLRAAEVPASAVAVRRDGRTEMDTQLFGLLADRGVCAVTSGDVVLDDAMGASVLSGDEILVIMARALALRRVVFVVDVDHVRIGGRDVDSMRVDEARSAAQEVGDNGSQDATGGIAGKLEAMAAIAECGTQVVMVNGMREGRLAAALDGKHVEGTVVEAAP